MAQNQCGKCGEMVDAAKAFCPGCGSSLIQEEQREASQFEKMDSTVQLGQTMYNQMLSDMGLSIEKGPSPPEKRVEIIAPVAPPATSVKKPPVTTPILESRSSRARWIVIGAAMLAALLFVGLLAAGVMLYYFWPRIS